MVHTPFLKGSQAEKNRIAQIYRKLGLTVQTAPGGEDAGVYHLLQLLKGQKLKVFNTLNGFLSAYRTGDERALLLQCCYVLLATGRRCMRTRVVRQFVSAMPSVPRGDRGWMA